MILGCTEVDIFVDVYKRLVEENTILLAKLVHNGGYLPLVSIVSDYWTT